MPRRIRTAILPSCAILCAAGLIPQENFKNHELRNIGGIAYHLFREDGWFSQGLGALWQAHYRAPVMTIILIIAAIFVFKALYGAQIGGKRDSKIPDFVLFAFIATGIFFLGRLITTGQI